MNTEKINLEEVAGRGYIHASILLFRRRTLISFCSAMTKSSSDISLNIYIACGCRSTGCILSLIRYLGGVWGGGSAGASMA